MHPNCLQIHTPNPEHEAASRSTFTPVDTDLPQGIPRDRGTQLEGPVDSLFSRELAPLGVGHFSPTPQAEYGDNWDDSSLTSSSPVISRTDDTRTAPEAAPVASMSSGPPNCFRGPASAAPQPFDVTQAAFSRRDHVQTNPSIGRPPEFRVREAEVERTHFLWMPAGDMPSIARTSPTPPPARHVARRRPNLPRAHDALGLPERQRSGHALRPTTLNTESERDTGGESVSEKDDDDTWILEQPAGCHEVSPGAHEPAGPSRGRTLAEYDQTNARIGALNAELLSDSGSRPFSHMYPTSVRQTVRYLNIPGAAVEALMAPRPLGSGSRRRASSDGTGIVDISESESSEFESDEEGYERISTPGVTDRESEALVAEMEGKPHSIPLALHQRPERAASTATIPAEPEDCITMTGLCSAISDPMAPVDAHQTQWQRFRADPFVHDAPEDNRLPSRRLSSRRNSPPLSSSLPPALHRPGKKRARDPTIDGDQVRAEALDGLSLAREGKRRKAVPGASASAT